MTKNEAMRAITRVSSGTRSHIIGKTKYEQIEAAVCGWIETIAHASDTAFKNCETWMDVIAIVK